MYKIIQSNALIRFIAKFKLICHKNLLQNDDYQYVRNMKYSNIQKPKASIIYLIYVFSITVVTFITEYNKLQSIKNKFPLKDYWLEETQGVMYNFDHLRNHV